MKKSMIVITSLLAVALLATSAFSWGHGKGGFGRGCGGSGQGYGANALNDLSKEQRDELSALRQKFIDETYEVRSAMMVKHQEMRLLMETSSPDRAKLDAMSKAVTDLQGQMRSKRIDFQLAAKKIAPELNVAVGGRSGRGGCGGMGGNGGNGGNRGNGNCPGQGRGYNQ